MDYDLFQSDDDEDILSAYLQATQKPPPPPPPQEAPVQNHVNNPEEGARLIDVSLTENGDDVDVLPEFNCSGRDTIKTQTDFPSDGFMRNGYAQPAQLPRTRLDRLCFDFELDQLKGSAVMRYLHGEACKNIQKLCSAVAGQQQLQSKTTAGWWHQIRQQVTHFYHLLLHDDQQVGWHLLAPAVLQLRELLNCCLDADAWRVLYFAESSKGNECTAPGYHLYHGALEWRLLDLCVQRKLQLPQAEQEDRVSYQAQLERILDDLVLCAGHHYRSRSTAELLHTSAFMCRCNKELWLWLLQQQEDQQDSLFWTLFHRSMQRHKAQLEGAASHCEFYAWLRLSLARLSAYGRHGQQLLPLARGPLAAEHLQIGGQLKQFLACQPTEQQRRVYICLLAPLQLHWATQPDTDVLCQLWECLHRSLNSNFQLQLEQLPMICASGLAYLERYQTLLARQQLEDLNLSSFTLFSLLLGKTLQQLSALGGGGGGGQRATGNQAQKLLGRIFSKFSAAKLLALNEWGIHHVIELFLCLLLSYGEFAELAPKLREMLLCLQLDKLPPARRLLAAKGHMALLLLHAQRRQPFEDYVTKLLAQLAAVRNDNDVAGCFAATLQPIFELSDDFGCGEQLLLAPWLNHYVEHSAQASQERVWQALHAVAQKLRHSTVVAGGGHLAMIEALQQHVLPQLRVQFVIGYSSWLPKLAADFVALDKEKRLLESLLQGGEPANTAASAQLLLHVLQGRTVAAPLIMQVWIKSLVLLTPQHESVLALNVHVCQLEEFRSLGLDAADLENREPLCAFFGALGKRAQQQEAHAHVRMQLSHRLHAYVAHFEQWLPASSAKDTVVDRARPELGTRFYNFLAIVIYNCASLAYVRSKPTCFFHLAMSRFLLTMQLQTGATPEPRQLQLVHKIFPVLLQGVARLPYRTDAYLTRTMEQLLLHWTPHFGFTSNVKIVARPYATLLQVDRELTLYVLQHLATHFLAVQRMQPNIHIGLILTMMQQLFAGLADDDESQLLTLLRALHTPLLEHVMFVGELEPSRMQVLGLYRLLVNLTLFQRSQEAQQLCAADIRSLAEKHLAYCTYYYFQMLIKLAELAPQYIVPLYGFVRDQAHQVELKRGSGEDVGIRKCLLRLQQVLQKGGAQLTL